ncbi:MAG: extracellular solute-binding protein [Chloroflexi bacterium]|nr:extracellular solute-binding protein [Chloroflexota bacterium]
MKRLLYVALAFVMLGSLLVGCTAGTGPPAKEGPGAPAPTARAGQQGWEAEWQKTIEAGRAEGAVMMYATNWSVELQRALQAGLKERYGITLEFSVVGAGSEQAAKLERERIAGLYLADLIGTGLNTATTTLKPKGALSPIEPMLLLPDTKDPKIWVGGRLFLDTEQKYFIPLSSIFDGFLSRNTELVKEGEITSFADLTDPKWRGKLVWNDPTEVGPGNGFVAYIMGVWGPDKAKDFLRQMVKQEPLISRDYRLMSEWVAKGKVSVGIGVPVGNLLPFIQAGAPAAFVRAKEGGVVSPSGPAGIALPSGKLPHPNATKVYINWLLTKEGQTIFSKAMLTPAWRLDVPFDGLQALVPMAGSAVADEEIAQKNAAAREVAKEIFAPLLR